MRCLSKKNKRFFVILSVFLTMNYLNAENLYECNFNNKLATYHENDAQRMSLLGAECYILNSIDKITCSMKGVRVNYSRDEAERLLYTYPNAHCEINDQLYISRYKQMKTSEPLKLISKLIVYFSVGSRTLSQKSISKLNRFSRQHRGMGYRYNITGYASATGTSSKNYILSLQRAGIVRNVLLNGGINSNNILSVDALGEESLRYNTQYEMSLNRAVVIKAFGNH